MIRNTFGYKYIYIFRIYVGLFTGVFTLLPSAFVKSSDTFFLSTTQITLTFVKIGQHYHTAKANIKYNFINSNFTLTDRNFVIVSSYFRTKKTDGLIIKFNHRGVFNLNITFACMLCISHYKLP